MLSQASNINSHNNIRNKIKQYFFIQALNAYKELISKRDKVISCILSYAWDVEEHERWMKF